METVPAVKVGDIFYASWGYDQTNVDFYEVVGITASGKSVKLVPVAKKFTSNDGGPVTYVVAVPGQLVVDSYKLNGKKALTKKLQFSNYKGVAEAYVKLSSYAWAHPWDGQPVYETGGGWGH